MCDVREVMPDSRPVLSEQVVLAACSEQPVAGRVYPCPGRISTYMAPPITANLGEQLSAARALARSNPPADAAQPDMRILMEAMIMEMQATVCRSLEAADGTAKFHVDRWTRSEGGGGITCVLQDSAVFEKAGVNVSVVHGMLPPEAMREMRARGKDLPNHAVPFFACGISCASAATECDCVCLTGMAALQR
jgi:hypothetical protein